MDQASYWFKQTVEKPLFPDLLWSRPENKAHAGKLLIVGGNAHSFAAPAEAYTHAEQAGAGSVQVIMPDAVHKLARTLFPEVSFAPSTPSGSFSQKATTEILTAAQWADGVLLSGDLGHNSETAILIEKVLAKQPEQITITKDAAEMVLTLDNLAHANRLYVLNMAQLQKLATKLRMTVPITFGMDLLRLVECLHELTTNHELNIIVRQPGHYLVAVQGRISTTPAPQTQEKWRVRTATWAATWWLQNPTMPFEALTTAIATMT